MKQLFLFGGSEEPKRFTLETLTTLEVARDHLRDRLKKRPISPNYLALCPFHLEKTPSLTVHVHTNTFKCYGCGKGGRALKLLRDLYVQPVQPFGERIEANYGGPFEYLALKCLFDKTDIKQIERLRETIEQEDRGYGNRGNIIKNWTLLIEIGCQKVKNNL